jgi:hypothetical protein
MLDRALVEQRTAQKEPVAPEEVVEVVVVVAVVMEEVVAVVVVVAGVAEAAVAGLAIHPSHKP